VRSSARRRAPHARALAFVHQPSRSVEVQRPRSTSSPRRAQYAAGRAGRRRHERLDGGRGSPRSAARARGRPRPSSPLSRSAMIRPPGGLEVRPHPLRVDLEPFERVAQPRHRRAGRAQQLAERPPLGVPRAGGALVLVRHRAEQRRGQARAPAARRRARRSPPPGCACAASPTSRRPRPRAPRRPRSGTAGSRRARPSPPRPR
jgi:hypothetical protein